MNDKQRTSQQNKALWLWFTLLADELNLSGLDMKKVLKPSVDIPWNKDTIHDYLWVPVQEVMLSKKSTTELEKKDIDTIYEVLIRHLGEKFGISCAFPSEEELNNKEKLQ